ncbi:MAG: TMEM175 family protein [Mycoplasmatales bacterium]
MGSSRIEAFTAGVIAIMVLEMDAPQSGHFLEFISQILIYIVSFTYVGIYWMNHHHLFQTVHRINGKVMIINLIILFTLSLLPLATKWLSSDFGHLSLMFYGVTLFILAIWYDRLVRVLILIKGNKTGKVYQMHGNKKEIVSIILYLTGMVMSLIVPILSLLIYFGVATIWVVPDKRIEKSIDKICIK